MISAFRRYLDTWVVRGLFIIMVGSFVLWGIGDVVRNVNTTTWVAKVGNQTIEGPVFEAEFRRAMGQATQALPAGQEPTPEMRRKVGYDTLQQMIGQAALSQEIRALHITSPDAAVRDQVMAIPAFHGPDGQFNRQTFETILRNNGLNETHFLDLMRTDIAQRQLLGAIAAGATTSTVEVSPIYALQFEKRSADMAEFPIGATPAPPAPDDVVLQRWYDNHPDRYATPEYRHIKAIELSPQTLAKEMTVTDAELQAAYDQHKADYVTEAKRSAQVITAPDAAKAAELSEKWRSGADWAAIQLAAQAAGASAVQLDDATEALFPDPDLAQEVFSAPAVGSISAPIKGALGWFVVKVTNIVPGTTKTLADVKDELRNRVLADKAADVMYDHANKVDDLLANGTPFDQLPGDLGLAGVAGTLDSSGNTADGTPAPIPGPAELRAAIVAAAFQAQKGDPPRFVEVQTPSTGGSAYYAISLDDVLPPGEKSFDLVHQQVLDDWTADQQRHAAEEVATKMLVALKGGQSFADAATVAGVPVHRTPLVTRSQGADGMPPELQRVLFGLKKDEPAMVETAEAFIIALPADIIEPDEKADPAGYDQVRQAISRSVASDLTEVFAEALRQRASVQIDQQNVDSIVQP